MIIKITDSRSVYYNVTSQIKKYHCGDNSSTFSMWLDIYNSFTCKIKVDIVDDRQKIVFLRITIVSIMINHFLLVNVCRVQYQIRNDR